MQGTLDPDNRKALKLSASSCMFNFELANWTVLSTIAELLIPSSNDRVVAKLEKVTLYTPGGYLKPHKVLAFVRTRRACCIIHIGYLVLPSLLHAGVSALVSGVVLRDQGTVARSNVLRDGVT